MLDEFAVVILGRATEGGEGEERGKRAAEATRKTRVADGTFPTLFALAPFSCSLQHYRNLIQHGTRLYRL